MPASSLPVVPELDGVVVTAAGVEAFDCPVCDAPRDLVVVDIDDDHGERACADCGFAVALAPVFAPALDLLRRAG